LSLRSRTYQTDKSIGVHEAITHKTVMLFHLYPSPTTSKWSRNVCDRQSTCRWNEWNEMKVQWF